MYRIQNEDIQRVNWRGPPFFGHRRGRPSSPLRGP